MGVDIIRNDIARSSIGNAKKDVPENNELEKSDLGGNISEKRCLKGRRPKESGFGESSSRDILEIDNCEKDDTKKSNPFEEGCFKINGP